MITKNMKEVAENEFYAKMEKLGIKIFSRVFYRQGAQVWEYRIGSIVYGERVEICCDPARRGEFHWYC